MGSTEIKALLGTDKATQLMQKRKTLPALQTKEDDSDSGLEFEDAPTSNGEKKTFRDLLSLKKVTYTEKFGNGTSLPKQANNLQ